MEKSAKPTAWIIGASSGLGASLAVRLANEGYRVAISARRAERLDELAEQHTDLTTFPLDVADPNAAQKCAADVLATFGRLDLVVFCAVRSSTDQSAHLNMANGMAVGLLGATAALEPVLGHMKARKAGHIALVGSPVGFRALPGTRSYGVVKSALHYYAELMKIELAAHNIDVQLILPGFVETELTQGNTFPMPVLMSVDEATTRIWRGLGKPRRFLIAFPKRLIWPMKLLGLLPVWIYQGLWSKLAHRINDEKKRD
ncbi:SDR family NAD(P)-dependent oxidoreductase [uncultured Maritalea sp.]|uniref:SDR family NAD(P)-dependent oxidoreductase n=1 Tax=uncultured Maritalea sp. TaxID=757249 RepID=UPI00261C2A42|nr:SDR family NAD(P)-dependent oxidoreductase [uncultured Maritalea sp.]